MSKTKNIRRNITEADGVRVPRHLEVKLRDYVKRLNQQEKSSAGGSPNKRK